MQVPFYFFHLQKCFYRLVIHQQKCAQFPIINANLFIKTNHSRLFPPCYIIEMDGMKILFIGIITDAILAQTKQDHLIGSFIGIEEAAQEVGRICNSYNRIDIDFTVLLTHIGFEADKELAAMLLPEWGVDLIIGGHSQSDFYFLSGYFGRVFNLAQSHSARYRGTDNDFGLTCLGGVDANPRRFSFAYGEDYREQNPEIFSFEQRTEFYVTEDYEFVSSRDSDGDGVPDSRDAGAMNTTGSMVCPSCRGAMQR